MFKRAAIAISLLISLSVQAAEEPAWLKEARAREAKSLKAAEISSKDGWFKARVPGKLIGAIVEEQGSYTVELDIGGDASVQCEVYPKGVDLANALRHTLNNAFASIQENHGKLEARYLESSDAGAHGNVPYLALNWLYRVAGEQGALLGGFKQFVMEKNDHAVYCAHNDLGYTRTFAEITRGFADTLQTSAPQSRPHYLEIAVASLAGNKVGVAVTSLERDAEGDTRALQATSMFIATADGEVQAQDTTEVQWLRADGTLINAADSEVTNGEVESDLGLKKDDEGWYVEGKLQGKEVTASLPKDSQPGNWVAQALQLRSLLAEPNAVGREHTMNLWVAENADKLTVARSKILGRKGDKFQARVELGEMNADALLDKNGMISDAEMKAGPMTIKIERVYVSGSF